MEFEHLLTLVKTMSESKLTELFYEENGTKVVFSKLSEPILGVGQVMPGMEGATGIQIQPENGWTGAGQIQPGTELPEVSNNQPAGNIITSPLVGVFYAAPAEDAAPYVSAGEKIEKGQIVAIVEAMKLMNEIESEYAGTVAEIYVENGQAVEYGQPLFRIL